MVNARGQRVGGQCVGGQRVWSTRVVKAHLHEIIIRSKACGQRLICITCHHVTPLSSFHIPIRLITHISSYHKHIASIEHKHCQMTHTYYRCGMKGTSHDTHTHSHLILTHTLTHTVK